MGQGQQRPVPIKPPLNIDPIFVDVSLPVPWTLLWTSPEVVFSLVSVISSFILLVMYSSDTPVLGRNGLLAMGSLEDLEFLQGREAEAAPTAAPTVSADLLLLIVTLMSTSCFLKACCRVFLKAQRQLEEKQLEEKLAIRRDPAKRAAQLAEEAEKEVKLKNLEAENKERLAKDLPPKRQIVKVPKIHGVELFTNVVVAMSVSVCIAVVALIQTQRGNQMRGFGAVLILALLCAGIVIPTACHGLLSMQHVCGLSDVCCVLSILYLVYQSVSTQRG